VGRSPQDGGRRRNRGGMARRASVSRGARDRRATL
jgi:hypothetical protein